MVVIVKAILMVSKYNIICTSFLTITTIRNKWVTQKTEYLLRKCVCNPVQECLTSTLFPLLSFHITSSTNAVQRANRVTDTVTQVFKYSAILFNLWKTMNILLVEKIYQKNNWIFSEHRKPLQIKVMHLATYRNTTTNYFFSPAFLMKLVNETYRDNFYRIHLRLNYYVNYFTATTMSINNVIMTTTHLEV